MKKEDIISGFLDKLDSINGSLKRLQSAKKESLTSRPNEESWNALECIEHLVRYNEFYIPEFEKAILRSKDGKESELKRGWLGKKSADSMLPGRNSVENKMKTFKSKNTYRSGVGTEIFTRFGNQQAQLRVLTEKAEHKKIGRKRCKTTLPLVRFRLVDALEFIINHQLRHMLQAEKAANLSENISNRHSTPVNESVS